MYCPKHGEQSVFCAACDLELIAKEESKMSIRQQIMVAMAKAFFASAWSDQCEETGNSSILSGQEIMDIMPAEIDLAAYHAADSLVLGLELKNNGRDIEKLYNILCDACIGQGDREHTPEMFGHYAAMQAMGHGVGLGDVFGERFRMLQDNSYFNVPYVEFGSHSLQKDYFLGNTKE